MASRIRVALKAFALGRYLLTNHRWEKMATGIKQFMNDGRSIGDITKNSLSVKIKSFQTGVRNPKNQSKIKWYVASLAVLGFGVYEYRKNSCIVPITHRRHFAALPRSYELRYQKAAIDSVYSTYEINENGNTRSLILPENDERVLMVKGIVDKLCEACIYFSPECEEYMKRIQVFVVDSEEINAYTSMGSILVVYTGLLDHFRKEMEQGNVDNYEECIAGVLAHELSHSLSRHPVEAMLQWTGPAYYMYITLIPDLIVMPVIKGLLDKKMEREKEFEADYQALYLLKRSGYDPSSMITTLHLLPDDPEDDIEIITKTKEIVLLDHPRIDSRVKSLQDKMFAFQKDFRANYEVRVEEEKPVASPKDERSSDLMKYLISVFW